MSGKPKDKINKTASVVEGQPAASASGNALLAEWPPDHGDCDDVWMMRLSKGMPVCALEKGDEEVRALVNSGSAITAANWDLGSQFETKYVAPEKRPRLTTVSGSPIEHHGNRTLQGEIFTTCGIAEANLGVHMADVNKLVLSVSGHSEKGSSVGFLQMVMQAESCR